MARPARAGESGREIAAPKEESESLVATGGVATILLAVVIAAATPIVRNYDLSEHLEDRKDAAGA